MKILVFCMECQKELGHPSFEPILADYYDGATAHLECSRGHKSTVLLQSQKFEILLESAANALLEGFTMEAASSLSAAYERFIEFSINVFCKKNLTSKQALEETFRLISKQSERQLGGFLFLHLITFGRSYVLNKKITELRNKVIHQGYIPSPKEVTVFGTLIYQEIYSISQLLKSNMPNEIQQVIMDDLQSKNAKVPLEAHRSTCTGATFFSLSMAEQKKDFNEALAAYKEYKNMVSDSTQLMNIMNKMMSVVVSTSVKMRGKA